MQLDKAFIAMKSSRNFLKKCQHSILAMLLSQLGNWISIISETVVFQFLPEVVVGGSPVRRATHKIGKIDEALHAMESTSADSVDQLVEELVEINGSNGVVRVPDAYIAKVKNDLKTCPRCILCLLKYENCKVVLVPTVYDIPKFAEKHPRGYSEDLTYKNVPATFDGYKIFIGAFYSRNGKLVTNNYLTASIFHEIGHAVDRYLHDISSSAEFLNWYEKDEEETPLEARNYLKYYLQAGNAGPSETFAQLLALLINPKDSASRGWVGDSFPYCSAFIEQQFCSDSTDRPHSVSDGPLLNSKYASRNIRPEAIKLNRDGVVLLKKQNWRDAIDIFQDAMKIDSAYIPLRQNLADAHSGLALQLAVENKLSESLREFHQSVFLDSDNRTNIHYLNGFIGASGKQWDVCANRIKLGDEAKSSGDLRGAIVEYLAALKLKDAQRTRDKLSDVYNLLDDKDKALARHAGVIPRP